MINGKRRKWESARVRRMVRRGQDLRERSAPFWMDSWDDDTHSKFIKLLGFRCVFLSIVDFDLFSNWILSPNPPPPFFFFFLSKITYFSPKVRKQLRPHPPKAYFEKWFRQSERDAGLLCQRPRLLLRSASQLSPVRSLAVSPHLQISQGTGHQHWWRWILFRLPRGRWPRCPSRCSDQPPSTRYFWHLVDWYQPVLNTDLNSLIRIPNSIPCPCSSDERRRRKLAPWSVSAKLIGCSFIPDEVSGIPVVLTLISIPRAL